jgi:ferredoxin
MQDLRDLARRLLTDKTAGVVIGYEEGPRGVRPAFVTDPADVDRLVFDHRAVQNLATYLNPRRRHLAPLGKPAVVVKTCDARAVAGLIRETQIKREDIVLIGVRCSGVARRADHDGPLTAGSLADRCAGCAEREPHLADFLVGDARALPEAAARRAARVGELDALSSAERWEFWQSELARCVRCHACREVCPLCFCERCAADKSQPQWIESSPHPRGNLAWQINRALHLAGRCAGCDECERACPVGIPLGLITRKVAQVIERRFAYRAVDDPTIAAPIGAFRPDDGQEFIR